MAMAVGGHGGGPRADINVTPLIDVLLVLLITMNMISITSNTSMSGVTLMFALWPPLGPTAIPMVVLLYWPGAGVAGAGGAPGPVFL